MSPVDIRAARRNLERRWDKERAEAEKKFEQAACEAAAIIEMIRGKYRPRRIYQWGSLLEKKKFGEHSDIDIAVEGITDAERFFALLGDAEAMTGFSLDIVQMEKIEPEFAEIIRMKAKVVYDAEQ
jgi:predicted nucleotidyltransferase